MLHSGAVVNPEYFEKISGIKLEEEIGEDWLDLLRASRGTTGARCLVLKPKPEQMYKGLIEIPETAQQREQLEHGCAWIIAVGSLFGRPDTVYPFGVLCDDPTDALGRYCYVMQWAGKTFKHDRTAQGEFEGRLVVLTGRDIQMIDMSLDYGDRSNAVFEDVQ